MKRGVIFSVNNLFLDKDRSRVWCNHKLNNLYQFFVSPKSFLYAFFTSDVHQWQEHGNFFFRWGVSRSFFEATSVHIIEVQNMIRMINFDVWDRLGHVRTILDTVGLWGSIFHCHIYVDCVSNCADLSVCKAFIRELLIKASQTLKSAHFDAKSSQIWQWKIDPHNPTVSRMVRTCPNRSQTSKLIFRITFWTSITCTEVASKKLLGTPPLKKIFPPSYWSFS